MSATFPLTCRASPLLLYDSNPSCSSQANSVRQDLYLCEGVTSRKNHTIPPQIQRIFAYKKTGRPAGMQDGPLKYPVRLI